MSHALRSLPLALTLLIAPALAHAAEDCKIATKGTSPVAEACKQGGIKKAKSQMKALVSAAKKKGVEMDCDQCHKNDTAWTLSGNAEKDFKKLLDAAGVATTAPAAPAGGAAQPTAAAPTTAAAKPTGAAPQAGAATTEAKPAGATKETTATANATAAHQPTGPVAPKEPASSKVKASAKKAKKKAAPTGTTAGANVKER